MRGESCVDLTLKFYSPSKDKLSSSYVLRVIMGHVWYQSPNNGPRHRRTASLNILGGHMNNGPNVQRTRHRSLGSLNILGGRMNNRPSVPTDPSASFSQPEYLSRSFE